MAENRAERIGEAQSLGLQGYYDAAFDILDDLLNDVSTDVASLRMKGNLLELKAFDLMEYSAKKLTSSADYLAARRCYEKILEVDSRNVKALTDLGDHYRNLDANDKAIGYYGEAMRALEQAPKDETWKEDVEDLLKAVALLTKHDRVAQEARSIEAWCSQALGNPD
jgi:tetratricopeptide (TPR) repeat protein